jgi:ketosteroid isomerase-like protein
MRTALAACLVALGCSSTPTPVAPKAPAPPSTTELSPALAPLAWWLGDWETDLGTEHWIAADGAVYGIALQRDGAFEVMIVDDGEGTAPADGVLRFVAMPNGERSVEFRVKELGTSGVTFENPEHDFPKAIAYERTGDELKATLSADGARTLGFTFRPGTRTAAPELEAADKKFAADVDAGGAAAWANWFAPDGGMMRKSGRVERASIENFMKDVFDTGMLAWEPIASGRAGAVGFTVGKATFTGKTPEEAFKSTYVTIWKQQPDGEWKVWFDTGRVVNAK